MSRRLPTSGIYRLALYNRYLSNLNKSEQEYVSSQELADVTGNTAEQVRKDLTYYGSLGEPGKGYEIGKLKRMLINIFGKDKVRNVILVGVGNLGMALMAYKGFELQQFKIVAAFDNDMRKIGRHFESVSIDDIRDLKATVANLSVEVAIVAVPTSAAQEVTNELISAGIKSILNFAPARVSVPKEVELHNVDLSIELDKLYYLLKNPRNF